MKLIARFATTDDERLPGEERVAHIATFTSEELMREKRYTEGIMIRLSPAMLADVRADAAANGRTVTQTIRLAIQRFLKERNA